MGNDPVNRVDPKGTHDLWGYWKNLGQDVLEAVMDIMGMKKCGDQMGRYQKLQAECRNEMKNACGEDDWLENPDCEKFNGGVSKSDEIRCIERKAPGILKDLVGCW